MRKFISRLVAGLSLVAFLAPLVAAAEHTTLLVFPLENLTGVPALSWVSEGTSESICTQVRIPGLEVVARETRLELVEDADLPPNATLSRASMMRVAQLARADYLVFGSFSGSESALRVVLAILDMKTMKLGPDIVLTGLLTNLPEMENELAWQVLAQKGFNRDLTREEFHKRARKVPNSAYLYFIRSLGAPDDQSPDLLAKAIEAYSDFPGALFRQGSYYFEKGECSRAVELLERIPGGADHFQEARSMLGTCHCKLGNSSKAIQAYVELLPFDPSMETLNNLGVSYLREGDLPLAANSLKRARELAQSHPVVALNLGILRHLQGDEDQALPLLDEAYRSSAAHGLVQYLRSRVLQALGRTRESSEALADAVHMGIDPEKLKNENPRGWTQYIFSPFPPSARK